MAPAPNPRTHRRVRPFPVRLLAGCALAVIAGVWSQQAQASEGGSSLYLLGSGGPGAAEMPPVKGVFFDNTAYFLHARGGGQRDFTVGGNLVAGLKADVPADFGTVLWVPSTDFLGGTAAIGAAIPFGEPSVHVSAIITGPLGNQIGVGVGDSKFLVGDPIVTGALGWKSGKTAIQASTLINIPVGDYRAGHLANLAFHRWAGDLSFAGTWHDKDSGWDVSGKAGVTFNGENDYDDYKTGTESHFEASLEKTLSPAWSAGIQGYYFYQLTGDSGAGATLGSFKGRAAGVGGTVGWTVMAGHRPVTVRVRALADVDTTNRPKGKSLWLDIALPLKMWLPAGGEP